MSPPTLDVSRSRSRLRSLNEATSKLSPSLSSIETFLDQDNRGSHPLDFFLQLHFDRTLDSSRVTEAIASAVTLHPTLAARLTSTSGRRQWVWESEDVGPERLLSIQRDQLNLAGLDLESEPGVKCHLEERPEGSCLTFQFHHVATDGLGAIGFLSDFLKLYDGVPIQEIDRDARLLNNRHQFGYCCSSLWSFAKAQGRGISTVWRFLGRTAVPLKDFQPSESASPSIGYPQYLIRGLSAVESEGLRFNSVAYGVSMNSWMLACLFRTMNSVRCRQTHHRPSDLLRVAVPCNMRKRGHEQMPACNLFSLAFPAFRSDAIDESPDFVTKGDRQMNVFRRGCDLPNLLLSLKLLSCQRRLLNRFVSGHYCQATTLFTNLGRVFSKLAGSRSAQVETGKANLTSVFGIPPLRPLQSFSIATFQYAGRQKFGLRFDPIAHTEEEVASILSEFVERLTSVAPASGT